MTCICDHAGFCPLFATQVTQETLDRCRTPDGHAAELNARGIRVSPPAIGEKLPKPEKPKTYPAHWRCKPCEAEAAAKAGESGTLQPINPIEVGPVVSNRQGRPALGLREQFYGQSVFLLGGGPSLRSVDLTALQRSGITVAAMNNAATVIRPHLFFSVDQPRNFHEVIWRDPGVMKFTFDKHIKRRCGVDSWSGTGYAHSGLTVGDCPNVWGFAHCHGWDSKRFLKHPVPTWGPNGPAEDPEKTSQKLSVMLPAIWLLNWLGFRTIYLLGCDFGMPENGPHYAFDQKGQLSNNHLYAWLNRRFLEMRGHFADHGLTIINCTEGGNLTAFDRMPLDEAIKTTLNNWPETVHTEGHYRGP